MGVDEGLRRYQQNRFTDGDIVRCTGLSIRAWRELIRLKAVETIDERRGPGRGRIRLCGAEAFKRAAVIAALNGAGLSTAVSGQVAHFFPFHALLCGVCDPLTILLDSTHIDATTRLPVRRTLPARNWFDRDCPAKPEAHSDWLIEIYDGRFVGGIYSAEAASRSIIFGDLRDFGTTFVYWVPSRDPSRVIESSIARLAAELLPSYRFADLLAEWEPIENFPRELKRLGYQYEQRPADDPLRQIADSVAQNFTFRNTINISLAIKNALRRYLELAPALGPA